MVSTVTDNLGQTSETRYDSRGRAVFLSDPAAPQARWGNSSERKFDALGRLTETIRHMRVGGVGGALSGGSRERCFAAYRGDPSLRSNIVESTEE